jgi:outer membrane lipoprotein-sorting protein
MKIQSPNDLAVLRTALMLLTIAFYCFPAQAQTPIPSPSPAPPPITKTGSILVNSPSTVGRITKWVGSSNNGIGTIGDSVITESSLGTIGIGTNPFSDYKLGVGGGISALGAINTSAQYNIGGSRVLGTAGINNVLVGNGAGQNNTANDSSFFGFAAGQANTDGIRNSFFGSNAGRVNITGGDNGFFGAFAGAHNTTGSNNSFFGFAAGQDNTTGEYNNFVGSNAGISNSTGSHNSFFGALAGRNNTTASDNAFFGYVAGHNTTGGDNAFFGGSAGEANTAGIKNSFFGSSAGLSNTTENNNTFIGAFSNGVPGITNATAIGANALVSQSNSIVLGNNASVGIGTAAPQAKLHVANASGTAGQFDGNVTINGNLDVTNLSASNLSNVGTINAPSNPVDWSALKNVPSAIGAGQVVNSVNGLSSAVTLVAGDNVTITPSGNTLTISASVSGQAARTLNPLQLATLRWYDMNEAQPNFTVGIEPLGLAFDGENMWVANFTCAGCTGTVSKLRRSDGFSLGTFNVGSAPVYVTFDGSNIWVGNRDSNNVSKLRVSDGATLGTFPTGGNEPQWSAFDGSNIWIANGSSSSVTKMRTSDGSIIATYPTGTFPAGVVFDGTNVWIANAGSSSVTKLRASDGANLGTFGVGSQPVQLAFDGSNIWVSNLSSNTVSKIRASDGATLGTFSVNSPHGIAFDGTNIWVVSRFSNKVTKLRPSDGVILKDSVVGNNPWGIAFDGINMWISVWGQSFVTKR